MNTRTGEIATLEEFRRQLTPAEMDHIVGIDIGNLTPTARRKFLATGSAKVSRNSPCPCGSGKRFKRCHMNQATNS